MLSIIIIIPKKKGRANEERKEKKRQNAIHAISHNNTSIFFLFISTSLHLRRAVMDFKKYKFFIYFFVCACAIFNNKHTHFNDDNDYKKK